MRRAYGAALLAMLVSCLLHLVATSYFLFVEILGANVCILHHTIMMRFFVFFDYRIFLYVISGTFTGLVFLDAAISVDVLPHYSSAVDCRTVSHCIDGSELVFWCAKNSFEMP